MQTINPEQTAADLVAFLKKTFAEAKFSKAVIAVSGGVDSATSLALAVRALGAENVIPVLLPYGILSTQGTLDSMELIQKLGIPFTRIVKKDIKPIVDAVLHGEMGVDNLRRGNTMARVRMTLLYDQAKKFGALVVGTENKSEHYLGYFTRFGDEASDIEPLRNLYKTDVYALAKYLGVTDAILTKAPSAGLWPDQTDEGEFGFTYAQADQILSLLYDEKKSVDEAVAAGFEKLVVEAVKRRVETNGFKHNLPKRP